MIRSLSGCRRALAGAALVFINLSWGSAFAIDSYDPGTKQLTIPSIVIGTATFNNLVVTVDHIVYPPYGTFQTIVGDIYDGPTQQLTVAAVTVGSNTYYNPVVALAGLVSYASVTGADTYDGTNLTIPAVQLQGNRVFTNIVVGVTLQDLVRVSGGLPTVDQNLYNNQSQHLAIPVVQFNGQTYTNVVVTVGPGQIKQVGGSEALDSVLYSFLNYTGTGTADGMLPYAGLVEGSDGSFYGTTFEGGASFTGTVFRVTTGGAETVLHSFAANDDPSDGSYPLSAVIQANDGNFYGTTVFGGPGNQGTVFKITPQGTESVLYSYGAANSGDGATPYGIVQGSDGNFYVATNGGGVNGTGAIEKITPSGTGSVLYSFGVVNVSTDGAYPQAALIEGQDGNFYGTTSGGGVMGEGTIFVVSPTGSETVLYSFGSAGSSDALIPEAALVQGTDGNLYGTTLLGGACHAGTAFRFTPQDALTILHSFCGNGEIGGSADGAYPQSSLIQASDGNFYGTTDNGGAYDEGTVYRLVSGGSATVLYSFNGSGVLAGSTDGAFPNGVIQGSDGNLYGTTYGGGGYNQGAVFTLTGLISAPP